MTINEMIKALEELKAQGYGNNVIRNEENDDIEVITESDGKVIFYFWK